MKSITIDKVSKELRASREERVKYTLNKALQLIKECDVTNFASKNGLLAFGDTGAGKSTLINLLAGKCLKVVEVAGRGGLLNYELCGDGLQIGKGFESCTAMPQKLLDNGCTLWDTPGLSDTRGFAYDILSAFYVNKITENASQLRFLLVMDAAALTVTRGRVLPRLIKQLFSMVKKPYDSINSTILVITKNMWCKNAVAIREQLGDIAESLQESILPAKIAAFLKVFAKKVAIVLFNLPNRDGITKNATVNIHNNEALREVRDSINRKAVAQKSAVVLAKNIKSFRERVNDIIADMCQENMCRIVQLVDVACNSDKVNAFGFEGQEFTSFVKFITSRSLKHVFESFNKRYAEKPFRALRSLADIFVCMRLFDMEQRAEMRGHVDDIALIFSQSSAFFEKVNALSKLDLKQDSKQIDDIITKSLKQHFSLANSVVSDLGKMVVDVVFSVFKDTFTKAKKEELDEKKRKDIEKALQDIGHASLFRTLMFGEKIDIDDFNIDSLRKKFPHLADESDTTVLFGGKGVKAIAS